MAFRKLFFEFSPKLVTSAIFLDFLLDKNEKVFYVSMTNSTIGGNVMPEKNKKKARSSKKYEPPSKIRLRKHLNADALFMAIHREFEKIPEFRTGDIEISIPDALMSAFAMFSLKAPSLLNFDERRKDEAECQNLKSIYGIENIRK